MFSLRDIAAQHIQDEQQLPEVVRKTIAAHAVKEYNNSVLNIKRNNDDLTPIFEKYNKMLDPKDTIIQNYSKVLGRDFYDVLHDYGTGIGQEYDSVTDDTTLDEDDQWFAYLEFMTMRRITTLEPGVNRTLLTNNLIHLHSLIKSVPKPDMPIPTHLGDLAGLMKGYFQVISKFNSFYEQNFSFRKTLFMQRKYVRAYKHRDRMNLKQKITRNFYKSLMGKYMPQYVPNVCKKIN